MDLLTNKFGYGSTGMVVQSLPRKLVIMSACTGTGMLELAAHAVAAEFNDRFLALSETDMLFQA